MSLGYQEGARGARILHVITGLGVGGAERALFNVLSGGLASHFDSAVVALRDGGNYVEPIFRLGVPVRTLGIQRSFPGAIALCRLRAIVREFAPLIIQGWMYHGNIAASVAAGMVQQRPILIWNVRQSLYGLRSEKLLTRQVIRFNQLLSDKPEVILYNSRLGRERHESFGFSSRRSCVIPNGFDVNALVPNETKRTSIRSQLGLASDVLVVGHIARFHPVKDHSSFLRAAVRIAQKRPDVRFLLAGRNVSLDNPAFAGVVPHALADRFLFLGERSDVQKFIHAMDVLCLSSVEEGFPNVLGEAMASGVPCVATDVGDSADIIGRTGLVVPPRDSEALAASLQEMLTISPESRRKLGLQARARIVSRYSLDQIVMQYVRLYGELISKRHESLQAGCSN